MSSTNNEYKSPIIACCTGDISNGSIALIRISGKNVRSIVANACNFSNKKNIIDVPSHTIHHGFIISKEKEIIDSVLFLVMDGPRTFTGEDTIEITCHNNKFIIQEIIKIFCFYGARPALPGEFTQRSFENKKIDLIQAEAIHDLIKANSFIETKKALSQLSGSMSSYVQDIEQDLIKMGAYCQASFEFLDMEESFQNDILNMIKDVLNKINTLIQSNKDRELLHKGLTVSCIGLPNAGKSSLFNALINKDKAIVSNIAGTTRDIIENHLFLDNVVINLCDTAGFRNTESKIEKIGVEKTIQTIQDSDLILLIIDASKKPSQRSIDFYNSVLENSTKEKIIILNKIDLKIHNDLICFLQKYKSIPSINISALKNQHINELKDLIKDKLDKQSMLSPFLINQRHFFILNTMVKHLELLQLSFEKKSIYYEIELQNIHTVLELISGLTGKSVSEETLDKVFREFCVGK